MRTETKCEYSLKVAVELIRAQTVSFVLRAAARRKDVIVDDLGTGPFVTETKYGTFVIPNGTRSRTRLDGAWWRGMTRTTSGVCEYRASRQNEDNGQWIDGDWQFNPSRAVTSAYAKSGMDKKAASISGRLVFGVHSPSFQALVCTLHLSALLREDTMREIAHEKIRDVEDSIFMEPENAWNGSTKKRHIHSASLMMNKRTLSQVGVEEEDCNKRIRSCSPPVLEEDLYVHVRALDNAQSRSNDDFDHSNFLLMQNWDLIREILDSPESAFEQCQFNVKEDEDCYTRFMCETAELCGDAFAESELLM